jgi:hypothetical protein
MAFDLQTLTILNMTADAEAILADYVRDGGDAYGDFVHDHCVRCEGCRRTFFGGYCCMSATLNADGEFICEACEAFPTLSPETNASQLREHGTWRV